jgi:CRISPR-associated protein Csm4
LLPAPRLRFELKQKPGRRKLLKRLRYVSPALFRRILRGQMLDDYAREDADGPGRFLQGGRVWLTTEELARLPEAWRDLSIHELRRQKVWGSAAVDRVAIDRAAASSEVFRIGRTVYAPGCGLWLGVQWPGGVDAAAREQLETLLHHLGDRGLGGERSVGYGQFYLEEAPFALKLPDPTPTRNLTLSRYLPAEAELPDVLRGTDPHAASYGLVNVVGWLGSPQGPARRRRSLRMLDEGSVLHTGAGDGPWGWMADVRPQGWTAHPVWRYGFACPVGVKTSMETPDISLRSILSRCEGRGSGHG